MLGALEKCPHEVEPVPGNEDWGRCKRCGADDFPITDAAAYGSTDCSTCHDTGMMSVEVPSGFADGPCPACRHEFAVLGVER